MARERIERHVTEVLAPQGHLMLITSRPAGIDEERFTGFRRLQLAPLTEAQQQGFLAARLGAARAAELAAVSPAGATSDAVSSNVRATYSGATPARSHTASSTAATRAFARAYIYARARAPAHALT